VNSKLTVKSYESACAILELEQREMTYPRKKAVPTTGTKFKGKVRTYRTMLSCYMSALNTVEEDGLTVLNLDKGLPRSLPSCLPFPPVVVTCRPFSTKSVHPFCSRTYPSVHLFTEVFRTYGIEEVKSSRTEKESFSEEHDEDIGFTQD